MDKQQQGAILADREKCEQKIIEAKDQLREMGQNLKGFAEMLLLEPESIIFTEAPSPFGKAPSFLKKPRSFNWYKIPEKKEIAQLIRALRQDQYRLSDIDRDLHSQTF